ncbi:MAG: hypothetical protein N4A35_17560 [Flavobacteriales bacterium]|jgi:hypothetical protein|nr:hypothetical protein [Flavobacteriales bacterium]
MPVKFLSLNQPDLNIPKSQRWIYRILFLRVLFIIITFAITIYVLNNEITTGFLNRVASFTLFNYLRYNSVNPFENISNVGSYLLGQNIIPFIILYFEFYTLKAKKVAGFWIVLVFDFLTVLSYPFLPVMPLLILILKVTPTAKTFFQNRKKHSSELLDDDL